MYAVDPTAVSGVMHREWVVFQRFARANVVASVLDPVMALLAFGFGFGALVANVAGYNYLEFVGTGVVATGVLFASTFPAMFSTFFRRQFLGSYDALLSAPVDTADVVSAEALFLGLKAGVFGLAPLAVAVAFGLDPSLGMLLVPLVGILTGVGFACFGIFISALATGFNFFDYVISLLVTPLFLFAGAFFPLSGLPGWAQAAARLNPLYHCIKLIRAAVFERFSAGDLGHVAVLLGFAAGCWLLAVWRMHARLVQ